MKKRSSTVRKFTSGKASAVQPGTTGKPVGSLAVTEATPTRLEVITLPSSHTEAPRLSDPSEMREVRFGYFQPDAHDVFVVGSFNGWNPRANPLKRDSLGDWSVKLLLPPGEYHYRLMVDGEWRDDPSAQQTAMNPFGGFDAVVVV